MSQRIAIEIFSTLQLVVLLALPHSGFTENRPSLSGTLELEQEEVKQDPYPSSQDAAIATMAELKQAMQTLRSGSAASAPELSDPAIHYLSGAYLFCMSRQGICPMLPKTILELDILRSRQEKQAGCPNMLRFWNTWIKNGFEQRHKYMVQTGFIKEVGEFNTKERPKLIKCEATVAQEIRGEGSDAEYFKQRYSESGQAVGDLQGTQELLEHLKEKIPNVFRAIGAAN